MALVDLKGEKKEQFNVQVDANKLSAYNLSLASVMKQIQSLSYKTPNITSSTQDSSLVVFGIKQAIENVKDLENLIISYNFQTPVYLKDIALIEKSFDIQNKKEALVYIKNEKDEFLESSQVTLSASKLKSTNSVTINENIFKYMDSIKDELLEKNIKYIITRDDGFTANNAVNDLVANLLISIVIIAILLIFTLGLKEAMIVSLMVPMILSLTLFTGLIIGETINRITLFFFFFSLGMLMDAAIIVIYHIHTLRK